jgi:hypothetical protein
MKMSGSKWKKGAALVTPERLTELVDAYGANPDRWPAHERDAAIALSAEIVPANIQDAAELDALLDSLSPPDPSSHLSRRLEAEMPVNEPVIRSSNVGDLLMRALGAFLSPRPAALAASMAIIFAVGVSVGWVASPGPAVDGATDQSLVFSLVGGEDDDVLVTKPDDLFRSFEGDLIVALH